MNLDESISDERRDKIFDFAAKKIVEKKLQTPAILFLEMNKPLSYLASQAAVIAMPMFAPLFGAERMAELSRILRDRKNVELLISKIEDLSSEGKSGKS